MRIEKEIRVSDSGFSLSPVLCAGKKTRRVFLASQDAGNGEGRCHRDHRTDFWQGNGQVPSRCLHNVRSGRVYSIETNNMHRSAEDVNGYVFHATYSALV